MQGQPPRDPLEPEPPAAAPAGAPPARDAETRGSTAAGGPTWDAEDRRRRAALLTRVLTGILLLTLFVVFISLNSSSVPVHFLFVETRAPLVWVFLVCALIGALVTYLLGRPGRRTTRSYIKDLERRLEGREEQR